MAARRRRAQRVYVATAVLLIGMVAMVVTGQERPPSQTSGQQTVLVAFNDSEINALTALNQQLEARSKRLKNPHPPDSLAWAAWIIGRLGGWDGYPSSKPPGPITFKNGLEYFHAVAVGWDLRDMCMP